MVGFPLALGARLKVDFQNPISCFLLFVNVTALSLVSLSRLPFERQDLMDITFQTLENLEMKQNASERKSL